MEDLEFIIANILKKQAEPIADQLANLGWLMNEFDSPRLPEVSVGYGFVFKNEKLKLRIALECEEDDIDEDIV